VSMYNARVEHLFSNLSAKTLQAFETIKHPRTYPQQSLLFAEGQSPSGMFILCSGRVRISSATADGKRIILKIAGPGDMLGLNAVVSGKPHQASAESLEPCQLTFVKRVDVVQFLKHYPDFCLKVAEQLSESYRAAHREVTSRANSVSGRLAKLLLEWRPSNGASFRQQSRIDLLLSHEQIAEKFGVTRETVSRTFSDLKKRGILRGKRSTWVICNELALKEIAESY
jgi:CRP/FNR family transcriptional regulator, cyclic AMP receptor protein